MFAGTRPNVYHPIALRNNVHVLLNTNSILSKYVSLGYMKNIRFVEKGSKSWKYFETPNVFIFSFEL